jgi:hypothetical protein
MTALEAAAGPSDAAPGRSSGARRAVIWALIVLASVIAIGAVLTTWVDRQMLDQQSWTDASAELIEDPEVRDAVSVYLVNVLYDNVDVAGELEQRLPPDLKALAGPAAGALRQPATDAVGRVLDSPRVQQLWIDASTLAQEKLVNVLEDKTGNGITTGDGVVTLDLGELATQVGTQLGLSSATLAKLPPDAGQITVMRSSQLAAAQTGVRVLRVLSAVLLVVVLGLYALAIYLARGERRRTLRDVGCAILIVGLVVLVVRRVAGNEVLDTLTSPASEDAAQRGWLIGTAILGSIGWAAIIYGSVVLLGAILAGPTAYATRLRARLAPALNASGAAVGAVIGGAFLLLVLWGPTHALRTLWGIALLGALVAAGVVMLRRQTLREFPGDGTARGTSVPA